MEIKIQSHHQSKIQFLKKLNKFELKYEYNIKKFCIKKKCIKKRFY